jgi:hypothetical protein
MSPAFTLDWRVQRPAIVVAAIVCGALAWWHRGEFLGLVVIVALFVPAGAVCALATGVWFVSSRSRTKSRDANCVVAVCIVLAVALGSLIPGDVIGSIDLVRAEDWAVDLAPKIERYREQHSAYPASLDEVTNFEDAPRLARRGELSYHAGVDRFYLYLPFGFMDGIHWSSAERVWTREKMR